MEMTRAEWKGQATFLHSFQALKIIYKKEKLRLCLQKEEKEPNRQEQTEPRAEVPKLEGLCDAVLGTQQRALRPFANCPLNIRPQGLPRGGSGLCVGVCVAWYMGLSTTVSAVRKE